ADAQLARTRLLILTSAGQRGDGERCRQLGIQAYLTKPIARADLIEAVGTVLAGAPSVKGGADLVTRHSIAESRHTLRILLAEDNPVNQQVATAMLLKRGHQVDVVANGREAVDAVGAERYDLVLMDIQMPEMDGFEATAQIRALPQGGALPISALTRWPRRPLATRPSRSNGRPTRSSRRPPPSAPVASPRCWIRSKPRLAVATCPAHAISCRVCAPRRRRRSRTFRQR